MECATHSGRNSVGYCKKCGRLGCEECLVRVTLVTGQIGRQGRETEALLCRECLSKVRPDMAPPKPDKKPARSTTRPARAPRATQEISIPVAAVVILIAIALVAVAAVILLRRGDASRQQAFVKQVAADALGALTTENTEKFVACVDVKGFMCRMDSTGVTQRDYANADRTERKQLDASHCDMLVCDFFVPANVQKKFKIVDMDVKEDTASVAVKPWIRFGKKLYKRILLHKKRGQWKIAGLASPDY